MRGTNKAKVMRRRASQRRATHKARRAALMLRTETRIAAVEARKSKPKVASKRPVKSTAKASKPKEGQPQQRRELTGSPSTSRQIAASDIAAVLG